MSSMTGNITLFLVMTHIYTVIKITTSSTTCPTKNLVIVHALKAQLSQSVNKTNV